MASLLSHPSTVSSGLSDTSGETSADENTVDTHDSSTVDTKPRFPSIKGWFYGVKQEDTLEDESSSSSSDGFSVPSAPSAMENRVLTLLAFPSSSSSETGSFSTADDPSIEHLYDMHSVQRTISYGDTATYDSGFTGGTDDHDSTAASANSTIQDAPEGRNRAARSLENGKHTGQRLQTDRSWWGGTVELPGEAVTQTSSKEKSESKARKAPKAKKVSRWNPFQRKLRGNKKEKKTRYHPTEIEPGRDDLSELSHKSTRSASEKNGISADEEADVTNEDSYQGSRRLEDAHATFSIPKLELSELVKSLPSNDELYSTQGFEVPIDEFSKGASPKLKKRRSFLRWVKNHPETPPLDPLLVCESADEPPTQGNLPITTEAPQHFLEVLSSGFKDQNIRIQRSLGSKPKDETSLKENAAHDWISRKEEAASQKATVQLVQLTHQTDDVKSPSEPFQEELKPSPELEQVPLAETRSFFDFAVFSVDTNGSVSAIGHQVTIEGSKEPHDRREGSPTFFDHSAKSLPESTVHGETPLADISGSEDVKKTPNQKRQPGESLSQGRKKAVDRVTLTLEKAKQLKATQNSKRPPIPRGAPRFKFSTRHQASAAKASNEKEKRETTEPLSKFNSDFPRAARTRSSSTESALIESRIENESDGSSAKKGIRLFPFSLKRQNSERSREQAKTLKQEPAAKSVVNTPSEGSIDKNTAKSIVKTPSESSIDKDKPEKAARSRSPFFFRSTGKRSRLPSLRRKIMGSIENKSKEKNKVKDSELPDSGSNSNYDNTNTGISVESPNALRSDTLQNSPPFWQWSLAPNDSTKQSDMELVKSILPPIEGNSSTGTVADVSLETALSIVSDNLCIGMMANSPSEPNDAPDIAPVKCPSDAKQEHPPLHSPSQDERKLPPHKNMGKRRKTDLRSIVKKMKGRKSINTNELVVGGLRHDNKTIESAKNAPPQVVEPKPKEESKKTVNTILPRYDSNPYNATRASTPLQFPLGEADQQLKMELPVLETSRSSGSKHKSHLREMVGIIQEKKSIETMDEKSQGSIVLKSSDTPRRGNDHDYAESSKTESRHQSDEKRHRVAQSRIQPDAKVTPPNLKPSRLHHAWSAGSASGKNDLHEMVGKIKEKKRLETIELEAQRWTYGNSRMASGLHFHGRDARKNSASRKLLQRTGRSLQEENLFLDALVENHAVGRRMHSEKSFEQSESGRRSKGSTTSEKDWYKDLLPWTWAD
jgi:hypothetical protein